jgi:hypothetical protein
VLAAAAWRLAGALIICAAIGPTSTDGRAGGAFTFLVELPFRLVFLEMFLRTRLQV